MGKIKAHRDNTVQNDQTLLTTSTVKKEKSDYAKWCERMQFLHKQGYVPQDPLAQSLRARINSALYELRNDDSDFGIEYHVFAVESAILDLQQFLTINKL